MSWYGGYAPYVSLAERKKKAAKLAEKLKKKGEMVEPIIIESRTIANTFWGKAWCKNLEKYSDYDNRLPRGRTYARNGSIIDLKITEGEIKALVSGSAIYKVNISITKVIAEKWHHIVDACRGRIDSLIELLQGKFSKAVMEIISNPDKGLFPHPKEIKFSCSCPDWADMCKHVAAVLYGVGARLDTMPEALFLLRKADHFELIAKADSSKLINDTSDLGDQIIVGSDLSSLFGIDLDDAALPQKNVRVKNKKPTVQKQKIAKIKKPTQKKTKPVVKAEPKNKKVVKKKITIKLKKSDSKSSQVKKASSKPDSKLKQIKKPTKKTTTRRHDEKRTRKKA